MTKIEDRPCVCGCKYIENKKYNLCGNCNYKRLHNGKTKQEIYNEKPKKEVKRTKINYTRKATGEKELFLEIWQERPHICINCKEPLGDEPIVSFFSHIKSKGSHSELRLDKNNIELLCFDCHYTKEFSTKEKYNKRKHE
jgi:hypothetical protein